MPDPRDHHDELDPGASEALGARVAAAAATVYAPPALRARLAAQRSADAAPRRRPRVTLPALAGAAGALAAVVVAVVLLAGGGSHGASTPSVDDAVAVALARPTAPAPPVDAGDEHLVQAQVGGVQFPNYGYTWPAWRLTGARHDRLGGRPATTLVYRGPAGAVGYTIVDGAPLPEPAGARHVRAGGLELAVIRRGGATVVTWRRGGHTCVLATRAPRAERQLVRFATWA
ncbi:MAG: hypothetical protein QOF26_4055 [Baekduia sp.]|nr:hypothetical protein [Baekduia sp.]